MLYSILKARTDNTVMSLTSVDIVSLLFSPSIKCTVNIFLNFLAGFQMVDFPTSPFLRFLLYDCLLLHFVIHWKKRKVRGIKCPDPTPPLPRHPLQLWVYRNGDVNSHLQNLFNITSGYIRTLSCNVFSGLEKKWLKEPPTRFWTPTGYQKSHLLEHGN